MPTALARGVRGSDANREREIEEVRFFPIVSLWPPPPPPGPVEFMTPLPITSPHTKQTPAPSPQLTTSPTQQAKPSSYLNSSPSHSPEADPDNQKMRVLAEGDVSAAQRHKVGFGEEEDLAADLERKKEEQEIVKKERRGGQENTEGDEGKEVDVRAAVEGEAKGTVVV